MCAPSPLAQALGIYVDIVSIDLLFASADKFNSGTAAQTRRRWLLLCDATQSLRWIERPTIVTAERRS
jgi:hypothetical protein